MTMREGQSLPAAQPGSDPSAAASTVRAPEPAPALEPDTSRGSLAVLAFATFVFGTAELVIVGVLDRMAMDLHIGLGTAGQTVTLYGIGIAVGGPLLTATTMRWTRRATLIRALVGFAIANALAATAPDVSVLLVARFASGALHGVFVGAAFVVAIRLVEPARMGRAIAAVLSGIAMAAAVGVPLGTFIGRSVDWRATFGTVAALAAIVLVLVVAIVPRQDERQAGHLRAQARYAFAPKVVAVLLVAFLIMGGQFIGITYLTPFLRDVVGVSDGAVPVYLLAYGGAVAAGTLLGGRAADASARAALVLGVLGVMVAIGAVTLGRDLEGVVVPGLVLWGLAGFGLVPSFQHRVVVLAGPGRDLASGLPASTAAAGIAAGAAVGGLVVDGSGLNAVMWTSLAICSLALPATAATWSLREVGHHN